MIRRHVPDPAYRVFLFGSRATGSAGERSDIDIGIDGPAPVLIGGLGGIALCENVSFEAIAPPPPSALSRGEDPKNRTRCQGESAPDARISS